MFHYVGIYTFGDLDLNGALELSTFFLLSGFCLTLKYGRSVVLSDILTWSWFKVTVIFSSEQSNVRDWSAVKFLRTRISRILPMYYVANIIGYFGR